MPVRTVSIELFCSYIEFRILMGQYIEELQLPNNRSISLVLSSLGALLFKTQTELKKALKEVLKGCKSIVVFKSQNI